MLSEKTDTKKREWSDIIDMDGSRRTSAEIQGFTFEDFDIDGDVPWDEIEPGIKGTVWLLTNAAFRTIGSCEGHDGSLPWVNLTWYDPFQIAACLHRWEASGFTIRERWEFLSKDGGYRFIEVEFWGPDCLPKIEYGEEP